jgi:hypothetical protein
MLDSDFWRELAVAFGHPVTPYDFEAIRRYSIGRNESTPNWQLVGSDSVVAEFNALAYRAASKFATRWIVNLTEVWLDALWQEATTGPYRQASEVIEKNETTGITRLEGKIDRVFRASSALCRKLEARALQVEFEERQRRTSPQELISAVLIPETPPDLTPIETIATQILNLRLACNWTIEKLAAKTGFDEKTVKRHLSGRVIPRLGNLSIYEQAFSKALKREVVIKKMPPKRPLNAP